MVGGVVAPLARAWQLYELTLAQHPLSVKVLTGVVGTIIGDFLAQKLPRILARVNASREQQQAAAIGGDGGFHSQTEAAAAAGDGDRYGSRSTKAIGDWDSSDDGSNPSSGRPGLPQPGGVPPAAQYDYLRTARLALISAAFGSPIGHFWFDLLDRTIMPHAPTSAAAIVSKMLLDQLCMTPLMTLAFFTSMAVLERRRPRQALQSALQKLRPTLIANYAIWPLCHLFNFAFVPPQHRVLYVNVIAIAWTSFMSHMAATGGGKMKEN